MKKALSFCALAFSLVVCGSAKADTPGVSFTNPGSYFNNGSGYSLGWQFTTNNAITIDSLGYFDNGGLTEVHNVGIYNSSGVLLASATINGTGTQNGFFNYVSIAPLTLAAGETYQVMGNSGYSDPYAFDTTNFTVDPNITFDNDEFTSGNTLAFGTTSDGTTAANGGAYFGPNFLEGTAATPEPGSFALLGTGLLGFAGIVRRRLS